jgi:NAD(P)-dependent dehydrogenase (short-subunit alcohol dehydrogenase family)
MASRSLEKAKSAMSEIEAAGIKGQLSTVQLDVTDKKSIEQAVAIVQQEFGRLDVLVNNAAVGSRDPDVKTRFQLCMDTNVIGPAVVSAAFRPLLLKSSKPYSIYVSSGVGSLARASDPRSATYRSLSNGEAYRASKAALNMLALQESIEFSSTALKVFAFCPGFVRSNLRGESEDARSGWGAAGDPKLSGEGILSIMQGERDADAGQFVHKDGIYPW